MKVEQVSEHIWSISSKLLLPIHVWLVVDDQGVTLVDTGMKYMTKGIMKAIGKLNLGPLNRILLTHGHGDHTGAVTGIMEQCNVPVYAHEIEIPYLQGDLVYPRRKKLEANLPKGLAKPLPTDTEGNLVKIGGLTPYFTPGHSPGHVAYYHEEDQVLLAGDLFTSKKGELRPPMKIFTGNMEEALQSSTIITKLTPVRIEVCHGNAVLNPAEQMKEYSAKYR
ncbi:MBL fold metallo-hydrolase [Chungangia koreensis]|uniref:MBL fold metallo-hydrolase n=1 Tax=Chungangia koreensis TaxID=752657 RepID=A0ABV8XCC1_9LACT